MLVSQKQFDHTIQLYTLKKFDFSLVETSTNIYILSKKNRIYVQKQDAQGNDQKEIPKKFLHLFANIKKQASKVVDNFPMLTSQDVCYTLYNPSMLEKSEHTDIVEIDINAAYPTAAARMGVISEDMLAKLTLPNPEITSDIQKKIRLLAIGSLATRKRVTAYIKGQPQAEQEPKSPTRHLFFNIAREVGENMKRVLLKFPTSLFFWVDAIYCPADIAQDIIKELGFECKIKPCQLLTVQKIGTYYQATAHRPEAEKKADRLKPYTFGNSQNKDIYKKNMERADYAKEKTIIFAQDLTNPEFLAELMAIYETATPTIQDIKKMLHQAGQDMAILIKAGQALNTKDVILWAYYAKKYIFD